MGKTQPSINWDEVDFSLNDYALAEKLGCSRSAVWHARTARKLSPGKGRRGRGRGLTIDWEKQPLGEMKDHELAEKLGCSRQTVLKKRKEQGIPRFKKG